MNEMKVNGLLVSWKTQLRASFPLDVKGHQVNGRTVVNAEKDGKGHVLLILEDGGTVRVRWSRFVWTSS